MNIFITINSIDCDILALQEINHLNEDAIEKIHTRSVMMKKERNHERGGGTMTLSELNIPHWDERNINKVCSLMRLVIDGVFVIWFGNIYLNRGHQNRSINYFLLFYPTYQNMKYKI